MAEFDDIRICVPGDEPGLLKMLARMSEENAMAKASWPKIEAMVKRGTQQELGIVGVVEGKAGIEASAGFILSQWWYSDDWHLEEVWTYVVPEFRRAVPSHAKKLYRWGKHLSRQLGMPVLFGVLTTKRCAAKIRLAQREVPQVGALFLWPDQVEDSFNQRDFDQPELLKANANV